MNNVMKGFMKKLVSVAVAGAIIGGGSTIFVEAATQQQKEAFRKEYMEMLLSGDGSVHNIRQYNLQFEECNEIATDVEENEGKYAYKCYYNQMLQATMDGKYVDTVWLYASDEGFEERYKTFMAKLSEAKKLIAPEMTDMEILLSFHDYVVKNTYYKDDGTFCHREAGPLGLGYGVCDGYTRTLSLLLDEYGIESKTVSNPEHMWLAVKIDGEMYHVDPTWADTRTTKAGEVSHYFFVRNDKEYLNSERAPHMGFEGTVAVSNKYTDWYVHDIVGEMLYEDGYWYYEKNGAIVRNDIAGEAYKLMIAGENLKLEEVKDGIITYSENGKHYESSIKKNDKFDEEDKITVTPTVTKSPTVTPTVTVTKSPTVTPTKTLTATPTEVPVTVPTSIPIEKPTTIPTEETTTTSEVPTQKYQELNGILVSQDILKSCFGKEECFEDAYRIEYKFGVAYAHDKTKIYYVKVWSENGELLREYVPVIDTQGRVCIYEKVTDTCKYYFAEDLSKLV